MRTKLTIKHPLYSYPDTDPNSLVKLGWAEGFLAGGSPYRVEKYQQNEELKLAIYALNSGMMFEPGYRKMNNYESEGLLTSFGNCNPEFALLEDEDGDDLELIQLTLESAGEKLAHCEVRLFGDSREPLSDPNDELLARAISFAAEKHKGQVRKGTNIPYIVHPMEAAAIVASMTSDRELLAAAVLHDTLEDCGDVTPEILREMFGDRVAELVEGESEKKQADALGSWQARKQATIDRLLSPDCSLALQMLTLGDKLSNLRAIHSDQMRIGDQVWERFNQPDKGMHRWYYSSIGQALLLLKRYPAMEEYIRLLDKVFSEGKAKDVPALLTVQQVPVYERKYYEDGDKGIRYEGYVLPDGSPWGAGRAYQRDGTLAAEGIFTLGGLLAGKMYYPSGQVKFDGRCNDKRAPGMGNYYGPTYPLSGKFYAEDGTLLYEGEFKVEKMGNAGYPKVIFPEGFGSLR
ncbi:MAG: HD domain-containing protein [Eubacteriales bacterium]|nr:HD domain-containing protein [Eubacteriales bacterium]